MMDDLDPNGQCDATIQSYLAMISDMQASIKNSEELIEHMSTSLADLDPNTHDAEEGKAFIRKIYKLRGMKPEGTKALMPETDEQCIEKVAGKVIQIDDLQQDLMEVQGFGNFFANVYCAAYVNSLVTMTDGLSMFTPGSLDADIVKELQRVYGPFRPNDLDNIEI